jgi:hypothetical protein
MSLGRAPRDCWSSYLSYHYKGASLSQNIMVKKLFWSVLIRWGFGSCDLGGVKVRRKSYPYYQLRIVEKVFKLHYRNIIRKFERKRKAATVLDSGLLPSSPYLVRSKMVLSLTIPDHVDKNNIHPVHFSESLFELYLHLYYTLDNIPLYSL